MQKSTREQKFVVVAYILFVSTSLLTCSLGRGGGQRDEWRWVIDQPRRGGDKLGTAPWCVTTVSGRVCSTIAVSLPRDHFPCLLDSDHVQLPLGPVTVLLPVCRDALGGGSEGREW